MTATDWRSAPIETKRAMRARLEQRRRELVLAKWPTPGALAADLDPTTRNPPHLQAIDQALVGVSRGQCERLMILMPPQEGKSERTSHYGALWLLLQKPELRIAIASYEQETARRWGQVIRDDLKSNTRLPLTLREDSTAAARWNVAGHRGGVYCVGIGGALTGRPVDLLLIDDPVKDRSDADSEPMRKRAWDWWTDVARTRLAPNAPAILIMTRWHADDLGGRIQASPGGSEWKILRIPAIADHRPELGETDLIGRQPGEPLPSARQWPEGRWQKVRRDVGERSWNALYQGKPSAAEGNVWKRSWWQRYHRPITVRAEDGSMLVPGASEVLISWDMAFKDTKGSDYVVGQVWARFGVDAYLVHQVRGRFDFTATLSHAERLAQQWPQAHAKLVEDKANGTAVLNSLRHKVPGLIPVTPTESKEARAHAVAPFVEGGNVHVPAEGTLPWAEEFVEEAAAFPNAQNDDQVDAASQALARFFVTRGARIVV